MNNIEKKLIDVLRESISTLEGEPEQILTRDLQSLQINSLNFIKIVVTIEDAFEIEFDDNQFNQEFFGKISNLAKLIEQKLQEKQ